MTANNDMKNTAPYRGETTRARRSSGAVDRIKMLIAAGAVTGTLGGWGLMARDGAVTAAESQPVDEVTLTAAQQFAPTSEATATLQQALQATATPPEEATATAQAATSTAAPDAAQEPAATATATEAAPTATEEVPTATPSPELTPLRPTATAVPVQAPQPVTRSRSSR
jgi:hypothetical protein